MKKFICFFVFCMLSMSVFGQTDVNLNNEKCGFSFGGVIDEVFEGD